MGASEVARYFALRAALVLTIWAAQNVIARVTRSKQPIVSAATASQPVKQRRSMVRFKIERNPARTHVPPTPKWMTAATARGGSSTAQNGTAHSAGPPAIRQTTGSNSSKNITPQPESDAMPNLGAVAAVTCPLLKDAALAQKVILGRQAREQLYCIHPHVTYLNHGSYGAAFRLCLSVQSWYREQMEQQCVKFMETVALTELLDAVAAVAAFVHADPQDVVPVENATTAVNAVLQAVPLRKGDLILTFNTTYPAVKNAAVRRCAATSAGLLDVQLGQAELLQPALVVDAVAEALKAGRGRVKLAILDHIVSFPPIIMPVQRLTDMCKKAGARVLVDGAHAIGNLPNLSIPSIGADYYTSNLHKWCCTPKGTALLWASREMQGTLFPLTTSHGYGQGFQCEWLWQGTADPTPWLSVPAALQTFAALGHKRVMEYNNSLVQRAADMLQQRWGTSGAIGGDGAGVFACMIAVPLPVLRDLPASAVTAVHVHSILREQHDIEVPIVCLFGKLYTRIAAQAYNVMEDYERLAGVIVDLMAVPSTARAAVAASPPIKAAANGKPMSASAARVRS